MGISAEAVKDDFDDLVYPSQVYGKMAGEYLGFFTPLFGNELMSFGYERLSKEGFYEGISSMPRIPEIFIETKAYQATEVFAKQGCWTEHGFIYPNKFLDQPIYNKFRIELDKQLGIYATFYAMQACLNYQHVFVWNFQAPLKFNTLTAWENHILLRFMNNGSRIEYMLDQFKKAYYQSVSKKITAIKLLMPTIQKKKNSISRSVLEESLIESKCLKKNDLYLKNLNLSSKEALCIHFYLQGMSAKEIAAKMFFSRRTVEDYIKRIKEKLNVSSRPEVYTAMKKVNLWRHTL